MVPECRPPHAFLVAYRQAEDERKSLDEIRDEIKALTKPDIGTGYHDLLIRRAAAKEKSYSGFLDDLEVAMREVLN